MRKAICIVFISFLLSACFERNNVEQREIIEPKQETRLVEIWDVEPIDGYDDVDNWLTTRMTSPTIDLEGSNSAPSPYGDVNVLFNREDFYNSEDKYDYVIGSYENGGAFLLKNNYAGVISPEGKITKEPKYGYNTYQMIGIIYDGGYIEHDYSVSEKRYLGGGSDGLSMILLSKDGILHYPSESVLTFNGSDIVLRTRNENFISFDLLKDARNKKYISENDNILINTYSTSIEKEKFGVADYPCDLVIGYVVLSDDGYRLLDVPSNYVPVDFSNNVATFIECKTKPEDFIGKARKGVTQLIDNYSGRNYALDYYAFEIVCGNFDYGEIIYVDSNGNKIASGVEEGYGFYEGYGACKKDGKWGYLDKNGNKAIDFIFEKTTPISDGKAWVKYNGKIGKLNIAEIIKYGIELNDEVLNNTENVVEVTIEKE